MNFSTNIQVLLMEIPKGKTKQKTTYLHMQQCGWIRYNVESAKSDTQNNIQYDVK